MIRDLALTLQAQGDLPGARKIQEQVLDVRRRVLGEEHPDTVVSAWNLLLTLADLTDGEAARQVFIAYLVPLLQRNPATLSANLRQIQSTLQRIG